MKLTNLLNRKIALSKKSFYILLLIGSVIGVTSGIYTEDFLRYLGVDFLADNILLIGLILTFLGSSVVLTNILFSRGGGNLNITDNGIFNKQISDLEKASSSIKGLEDFISQQKKALIQNKETIEKLSKEREKLNPIVETERELVDSILSLQTEKNSKAILKERIIGFLIGLISSSLASIIIWYFTT